MGVNKGTMLPEDMWKKIDKIARDMGINRSEFMRKVIDYFRTQFYTNPVFLNTFKRRVEYYWGELKGANLKLNVFYIDEEDDEIVKIIALKVRKPLYVVFYTMIQEYLRIFNLGQVEVVKQNG